MKKYIAIITLCFLINASRAQWVAQTSGTTDGLGCISFITNDTGYISSYNGRILKTVNSGSTWTQVAGPFLPDGISQIKFTSFNTGFAVNYNKILKTNNGGNSWINTFTDSTSTILYVLDFPTTAIGYALGQNLNNDTCFIYKTTDEGNN